MSTLYYTTLIDRDCDQERLYDERGNACMLICILWMAFKNLGINKNYQKPQPSALTATQLPLVIFIEDLRYKNIQKE